MLMSFLLWGRREQETTEPPGGGSKGAGFAWIVELNFNLELPLTELLTNPYWF